MTNEFRIPGTKYFCTLPEWADERTRFAWDLGAQDDDVILLVHPDHPPYKLNNQTKEWEKL